jgi:hypothetical protein
VKHNVKIGAGILIVVFVLGLGIYLANRPLKFTPYSEITASVEDKKMPPPVADTLKTNHPEFASSKPGPFKPLTGSGTGLAGFKSDKKNSALKITENVPVAPDMVGPEESVSEIAPWPEEPLVVDDAQLEMDYVITKMYEQEARAELPLLSVQTHNPFKNANGRYVDSNGNPVAEPPEAVTAGEFDDTSEFGNQNPPNGEIWIRIEPENAQEANEIMAQAADLYRSETGYQDEVKVMLWVGGRPFRQYSYVN